MELATKDSETPLFKRDGRVHGSSPWRQTRIDVQGNPINIGTDVQRGMAYQVAEAGLENAYVLISDLATSPAPAPGKTITHVISVYSDGSITIDGIPYP